MFVVYILTSCPPSHSFVVMSRQRLLFVNVLLLVTRSCDVGHIMTYMFVGHMLIRPTNLRGEV